MKYYYVKDGILNIADKEYIVVFTLMSSRSKKDFSQITIESCMMNVSEAGTSSIEVEWCDRTNKYHKIISEDSDEAFVINVSNPIYRIKESWVSFLPSGKWPVLLETEYAVETRD